MVNSKCRIEVTCSKRPMQTVTKTWSAIGWEWFGVNHPALPELLNQMISDGMGVYTDEHDIVYTFTPLDNITA